MLGICGWIKSVCLLRVAPPTPNPSPPLRYASWGEGNAQPPYLPHEPKARPCTCRFMLAPMREGGYPYAVSLRCGVAGERSKIQWLWVPAFAGTTANGSVVKTIEE